MPITMTGFAALVAACVCVMQAGLRRSILNPYLPICLSYVRFFGSPLADPDFAFLVDLANLMAFVCFSVSFSLARHGSDRRMKRLLLGIWPRCDGERTTLRPLSRRAVLVLILSVIGYAALDLWANSIVYGGFERAVIRFYALAPVTGASPWLMRFVRVFYWVSVMVLFALRLNSTLYGRGRIVTWLCLLISLGIAFPGGSVGRLLAPIVVCVIADILAALHARRSLRPRMDLIAFGGVAFCAALLLLTVRSAQFTRTQQVLDLALKHREEVTDRGVVGVGKSHTMVSEDVAFCLKTFGRSQDFLFGHTLYTILANPVPREMWTAKPVAFGRILGQIRQGEYGSPYAKPHGWSIAAGLAGEGYANGGYPGIIIVSLLVGFVSGKAGKLATVGFYIPSYPVIVLSLGFYRMSTLFVRGDVHSAWVSMAYPILALVFALCVLSRVGCVLEVAARSQLPRFSAKDEVCCGR